MTGEDHGGLAQAQDSECAILQSRGPNSVLVHAIGPTATLA